MNKTVQVLLLTLFTLFKLESAISQVTEEWVNRYNGPGDNDDYANAISVDLVGNVYITGQSDGGASWIDYRTIKYDSDGNELWNVRYTGLPDGGRDIAHDIAVDHNGYVYVTGESQDAPFSDYATVKYSPSGSELWVRRYNGEQDHIDIGRAIGVDSIGSVYITGNAGSDIVTIKYSSAGVVQWTQIYDGPDNLQDSGIDLTIGNDGNIYVTGTSNYFGTGHDVVTICYTADGIELWVQLYKGSSVDEPSSIVTDINGNVYVVGKTINSTWDYLILKYSPTGEEIWIKTYDGTGSGADKANDIAVNADGNIYITGESWGSNNNYDYVTLAYSPTGQLLWEQRYNGAYNQEDRAVALGIDYTGGIVVTGYGWEDQSNNFDYVTIKYNTDGVLLWSMVYDGPVASSFEFPNALAVDVRGNVIVTGYGWGGTSPQRDYTTVKYHQPSPEIQFSQIQVSFGEVVVSRSSSDSLIVSNIGDLSLVVSNITHDNSVFLSPTSDFVLDPGETFALPIIFSPDSSKYEEGLLEFETNDPGSPNIEVSLSGIGGIPVISLSPDSLNFGEINVGEAAQLELRISNQGDISLHIDDVFSANSVFYSLNTSMVVVPGDSDYFSVIFSPDSVKLEGSNPIVSSNDPINSLYEIITIGKGSGPKIIVEPVFYDFGPIGLDSMASSLITIYNWGNRNLIVSEINTTNEVFIGPSNPFNVSFGDSQEIIINFVPDSTKQEQGILIISSNDPVDPQKEIILNGLGYAPLIATDPMELIFEDVAIGDSTSRYFVVKNLGNAELEVEDINTARPEFSVSDTAFVVLPEDSFLVNVSFLPSETGTIFDTLVILSNAPKNKLPMQVNVQISIVGEILSNLPTQYFLYENYPNPFNPRTTIDYALPKAGDVSLVVYNLIGEMVKILLDEQQSAGYYKHSWDATNVASGVYFYRLQAGDFVQTRKMVLLK